MDPTNIPVDMNKEMDRDLGIDVGEPSSAEQRAIAKAGKAEHVEDYTEILVQSL